MILRLTVRDAQTFDTCDVEIAAAPDVTVGALLDALPLSVRGRPCYVGAAQLDRRARLPNSLLAAGAVVSVGGPGPHVHPVLPGAVGILEVTSGEDTGLGVALGPGRHTVSRDGQAAIPLRDTDVSRRHAEIEVLPDGRAAVADTGSTNGTFVAGVRIIGGTQLVGPFEPVHLRRGLGRRKQHHRRHRHRFHRVRRGERRGPVDLERAGPRHPVQPEREHRRRIRRLRLRRLQHGGRRHRAVQRAPGDQPQHGQARLERAGQSAGVRRQGLPRRNAVLYTVPAGDTDHVLTLDTTGASAGSMGGAFEDGNGYANMLIHGDVLYVPTASSPGYAAPTTGIAAIDLNTGKQLWRQSVVQSPGDYAVCEPLAVDGAGLVVVAGNEQAFALDTLSAANGSTSASAPLTGAQNKAFSVHAAAFITDFYAEATSQELAIAFPGSMTSDVPSLAVLPLPSAS